MTVYTINAGNTSNWLMLIAAVSATVWSYAGFPNILYMAGEIKDPGNQLPKALIGSTVFVTIIYTLVAFATAALIPHQDLIAIEGFANPFRYIPWFASIAGAFLAIAAFVSMIGATNACIMVQPRIEYAIARDGLFFPVFGRLHPKFLTPANSIILQSVLAVIMLFVGGLEDLLAYFTLSYVLQNLLVYLSIFKLKLRSDYQPSYHSPAWMLMTILSILFQIILLIGTLIAYPLGGLTAATVIIITGWPVYHYFKNINIKKKPSTEG